jgi:hypothetical protein
MGDERDVADSELGRKGHVPSVPATLASLPARVEAQETEQNAKTNTRRAAAEEAAAPSENGKRKGMRFRLARWFHKLGSSSR